AVEPARAARFDARQDVLGALLAHALDADEVVLREAVDVCERSELAGIDELVDELRAEAIHVHLPAGAEPPQALLELLRAGGIDAADIGGVGVLHDRLAARGAGRGRDDGPGVL